MDFSNYRKQNKDMSNLSTFDEIDDFASVLSDSRLGKFRDSFDVIRSYRKIAGKNALHLANEDVLTQELEDWELEARFWQLLEMLTSFRVSEEEDLLPTYYFSSNATYEENLFRLDPSLREKWLIISWLQESFALKQEPDLLTSKWLYTKTQSKSSKFNITMLGNKQNNEIITELDLDAPFRQNKSISSKDKSSDHDFFKYIFHLLKSRKIDEALLICENTGNLSLKIAIQGLNEYIDPELDSELTTEIKAHGITKRALWRRSCWQMTQVDELDIYEKAIYGFLSGDLESVLAVAESWEDQLLAYLSHNVSNEVDLYLQKEGKISKEIADILLPITEISSTSQILEFLSHSKNNKIQKQSTHLIRILIGAVINNTLPIIVEHSANMINRIADGLDRTNAITTSNYLLRIMSHLVLFLKENNLGSKESDIDSIITAYSERLSLKNKENFVPLYVSYLEEFPCREIYSFLLTNITDPKQRQNQLELSRLYGIDIENVLKRTVNRVFEENVEHYTPGNQVTIVSSLDEMDKRLYRTVEWYNEARMFYEAITAGSALYRRLLSCGRIGGVKEFGNRIKGLKILKEYEVLVDSGIQKEFITDLEKKEFIEYDRFINTINLIDEWDEFYSKAHTQNWKSESVEKRILVTAENIREMIESWLLQLLPKRDNKLSGMETEEEEILNRLRVLYIPYFVFELHRIFVEARETSWTFLKEALELAGAVADEDNKLYELFIACGRLKEYLQVVGKCAALAAAKGEKGIYD